MPDPFRAGADDHARLDLARAGRHEHAGTLQLDDADAADVHRVEGVEIAQRRDRSSLLPARLQQGRSLLDANGVAVDPQLDGPSPSGERQQGAHPTLPFSKSLSRLAADSTAP